MKLHRPHRIPAGALRRLLTGATCLALVLPAALAQSSSQTGTVSGNVEDANSRLALSGVRVSVEGTTLETSTDQQGNYRIDQVPAGSDTLVFSYVGYEAKSLTATVTPAQTARLDAVFGEDVVKLGEVKVVGEAVGTARAINQERAAPALTSIVAADQVGQLPDKNIAEALERVPGVDLYRDKGEGRFVEIEGLDPVYQAVDINGMPASTTEKGTRETTLDVISSDMIAGLEVNKVTTPDMDADDMGGHVNIRTRSGFDQQGPQEMISGGTNFSPQEDRHGGYNMSAYYGNQYDGGKLGVFVGAVDEFRPFTVYNNEADNPWTPLKSPTDGLYHALLAGQDFRHYDVQRWRHGIDGSLDFRISDTDSVWVRYSMSYYTERDNYWLTELNYSSYGAAANLLALNDTSATVVLPAKAILKEGVGVVNSKLSSSVVGGYDKTVDQWTNNLKVAYTNAKYTRPTDTLAFANTSPMTVTYAFSDPWHDTVTQSAGPSFNDPSQYAYSTKSKFTNTIAGEHEESVREDLRNNFDLGGLPAYIQVGSEYRNKNNFEATNSNAIGPLPFTFASVAVPDTQYQVGGFSSPRIPENVINQFYNPSNPYPTTYTAGSQLGSFQALEEVLGTYAEGGLTVGKLKILAGARLEDTHFWIGGWQSTTTTGGTAYAPVSYVNNYNNVLPDLILTYEITPRTIARASVTTSIARPDYSDTIPGSQVNDETRTISQGNPEIPALHSTNYDLSLEHYSSSLGAVEAHFFYKDITNFAYQSSAGIDPATGYALTTYYTAPSAWIYGLELSGRQRFGFLPSPFDGLGVNINGMLGDSQATYPTRPGEDLPFIGYAKVVGNAALTYEKDGLDLSLAVNHHSPRVQVDSALGTTVAATSTTPAIAGSTQDLYEDAFTEIDFGSSYSFLQHWQVYANISNLNNAPLREYYGGTPWKRLSQYEKYGPGVEIGLRLTN